MDPSLLVKVTPPGAVRSPPPVIVRSIVAGLCTAMVPEPPEAVTLKLFVKRLVVRVPEENCTLPVVVIPAGAVSAKVPPMVLVPRDRAELFCSVTEPVVDCIVIEEISRLPLVVPPSPSEMAPELDTRARLVALITLEGVCVIVPIPVAVNDSDDAEVRLL